MSSKLQDADTESRRVVETPRRAALFTDIESLQRILQESENDPSLELKSIDVQPACGHGVNFMSVVNRILVTGIRSDGSPYHTSLILKTIFEDKCHQEIFQSIKLFANEARVYRAIPALLGEDQKLVPNSIFVNADLIVLEDMKSLGFTMVEKTTSLDFEHAKLVLEALAHFHSASIVLEYADPEKYADIRNQIKEVVFPPDTDHEGIKSMINAIPAMIKFYLKSGASPEDDHAAEIAFFENEVDDIYDMIKKIITPKKYAVMCVGDCWITNLLFKYEEEPSDAATGIRKVTDVRLLDFQGARFASVAIDILYFLHTSVNHKVVEERNDELLEIYHTAFISKLENIPNNVLNDLSIDWLKSELKTHEIYGFFMSLWVAPATTMDDKHNIAGNVVASLVADKGDTPEYMKDKLSDALLTRIHEKCKYFLK